MGLGGFIAQSANNLGIELPRQEYTNNYDDYDYTEIKKSATWPLIDNMLAGLDTVPQDGDYRAFAKAYATVVWLYVAEWVISSSIASRNLLLYEGPYGNKDKSKLVESGPAYELLLEPNEFESGDELIEELVLNLETTGSGYWEKAGMVNNLPTKLFNLESHYMTVKPHPTKKIGKYVYDTGGGGTKKEYSPESIAMFRYANINHPFYGQGSVSPLQATLVTELYRESYNKSFFENEARPDLILKHNADITKGIPPLTKEQKRETAQKFHRAFGGPRRAHMPMLLESGMDVDILTEARRDMDFREMEKSLRERVFAATGVPPAMAGIYDNQMNSREQIRVFWTVTVPPKCQRLASGIRRSILKPYNPKMWCAHDLSDIPALEETPKEREDRLSRMLERAGICIGEYREALGFRRDESDKFDKKRIIASNFILAEEVLERMPEPEPGEGVAGGEEREEHPAPGFQRGGYSADEEIGEEKG